MKNEGMTTTKVEMTTRKVPSITFLGMAFAAMGGSALLFLMGRKETANFIGQWVPSLLILGTYNKIAKTFSPPYSEEQRRSHGGEQPSVLREREPVGTGPSRPVPSV
jgi:hypothetical protein